MTGSAALEGDDASRAQRGKRPTLKMVAEAAGVSTATVSYVLSGRSGAAIGSGVAKATAERVLAAAEALHYLPNRSAQAIRTGKNGVALLSLHMLSDPWSLAVAEAVNEAANEKNLTTVILADGDWYQALQRQPCDVAYIDAITGTPEELEKLDALAKRGQRLVVFSEDLDEAPGYDVVRSKSAPGARIAMEHLLENHTDIGCLVPQVAIDRGSVRYTPYLEALAGAGIEFNSTFVGSNSGTAASAFAAALEMLSREERPTAIYATTDFAAIAAINAALRLGLNVPGDVAVIGLGNTPDGQQAAPSLTTVGPVDFYKRQANIILDNALTSETQTGTLHDFEWTLIQRDSTATGGGS